jgi:hypothetical protein
VPGFSIIKRKDALKKAESEEFPTSLPSSIKRDISLFEEGDEIKSRT